MPLTQKLSSHHIPLITKGVVTPAKERAGRSCLLPQHREERGWQPNHIQSDLCGLCTFDSCVANLFWSGWVSHLWGASTYLDLWVRKDILDGSKSRQRFSLQYTQRGASTARTPFLSLSILPSAIQKAMQSAQPVLSNDYVIGWQDSGRWPGLHSVLPGGSIIRGREEEITRRGRSGLCSLLSV